MKNNYKTGSLRTLYSTFALFLPCCSNVGLKTTIVQNLAIHSFGIIFVRMLHTPFSFYGQLISTQPTRIWVIIIYFFLII